MKKLLKAFLGLAAMLMAGWAQAGGDFEGEVDMKVNRLNTKDNIVQYFVKGHKGRFNMDSSDGKNTGSGIYDWKTNQIIMLMDKQKMYMVMQAHPEKIKAHNNDRHFKITDTGKSLNILGHDCEEWDYTSDNGNGKIWFASGIGNWWANEMAGQYDKLPPDQKALAQIAMDKKLFPMKWESADSSNNYRGSGEVVKIEKKSLDDSYFEPPAGYKKMDLGNLYGGQNNSGSDSKPSGNQDPLSNIKPKLPF